MNDKGRRRRHRLVAVAALALGTALTATACGDDGGDKGGGNNQIAGGQPTTSQYQQMLAHAKCMRQNGLASWPDPEANGAMPNNGGDIDKLRNTPAFNKAVNACKHLEPSGAGAGPANIEAEFAKLLKYSKCMRDNGVKNFPDPKKENGGVGIGSGEGVDVNSPQYKAAQKACKALEVGGPAQGPAPAGG